MWEQVHAVAEPSAALAALLKQSREMLVFSALNFLMSDGQTLWVYRDAGDKRLDKGETLQDRLDYYTLYTAPISQATLVCSEPLIKLSKEWQPIESRTLLAFTPGQRTPKIFKI